MDMTAWAAWAQAIGSILAIFGSAWIGWWLHKLQVRADRTRTATAHLEDVRRTASLLRFAAKKVRTMHEHMASETKIRTYLSHVAPFDHLPQMHRAIQCLTEKDAPTASLLMLLIGAQEAYDLAYQRYASRGLNIYEVHDWKGLTTLIDKSADRVELAASEFEDYITRHRLREGV